MNSALRAERLDTGAQDWQANCDWRAGGLRHLSAGELMQEGGGAWGSGLSEWVSGELFQGIQGRGAGREAGEAKEHAKQRYQLWVSRGDQRPGVRGYGKVWWSD